MKRIDTCGNSESSESVHNYETHWILRFMNERENRYLEIIQDFFMNDGFNLFGLKEKVENFEEAYRAIKNMAKSKISEAEKITYLLLHQRYIFSKIGSDSILDRILNKEYGTCQRYGCENIPLIPNGISSEHGIHGSMVYCYNCCNMYEPKSSLKKLDGCAWGPGFAHYLIISYPSHFEKKKNFKYQPRLFGFKIYNPEVNN